MPSPVDIRFLSPTIQDGGAGIGDGRRRTSMDAQHDGGGWHTGRVFAGIVVILVGVTMLIDRSGWFDVRLSSHYWPVVVIVLGVMTLVDPRHRHQRPRPVIGGVWLIYVGGWLLLNEFHVLGFGYNDSWPLLIVGAGLAIVWRALQHPGGDGGAVGER
jgi:hypothetical protein